MKTLFNRFVVRRVFGSSVPITTTLLLTAITARADTPYTSTGWVTAASLGQSSECDCNPH